MRKALATTLFRDWMGWIEFCFIYFVCYLLWIKSGLQSEIAFPPSPPPASLNSIYSSNCSIALLRISALFDNCRRFTSLCAGSLTILDNSNAEDLITLSNSFFIPRYKILTSSLLAISQTMLSLRLDISTNIMIDVTGSSIISSHTTIRFNHVLNKLIEIVVVHTEN